MGDWATLQTIKMIDVGKLTADYMKNQRDAEATAAAKLKDRQDWGIRELCKRARNWLSRR